MPILKHPSKKTLSKTAKMLPSGEERMKRKVPSGLKLRPQKFEFDPKKAYTVEQLAEIGAITLKWNQIEAHIDFIGSHILFSKTPFWLQIATDKILGMKAKLTLLRESLKHSTLMNDRVKNCVYDCFTEIEQCRAYRNAIIHHHIYDHDKGIGSYIDESKSNYQILVSLDALTTLYNILCSLLLEVREIDILFRIETDAQRPGQLNPKTGKFQKFDEAHLKANVIPQQAEQVIKLQVSRKKLQKLPQFPDAGLVRSFNKRDGGGQPEEKA